MSQNFQKLAHILNHNSNFLLDNIKFIISKRYITLVLSYLLSSGATTAMSQDVYVLQF